MEKQKHTETAEASLEKQQKKLKNRKKLKYGGLATAITVIFVAVVVLVNVVVTQIGKRYPDFKLDLTTANLYAISDETLDYIRNMDKDVDIAISSDEATFTSDKNNKMIAETLSKYQGYSDRISVTYLTPPRIRTYCPSIRNCTAVRSSPMRSSSPAAAASRCTTLPLICLKWISRSTSTISTAWQALQTGLPPLRANRR